MYDRIFPYTIITVLMNLAFAYACFLGTGSFSMDRYEIIGEILPLGVWGVAFVCVSVAMMYSLFTANTMLYRLAIAVCGGIMATWGIALVYNMMMGNTTGPIGPFLLFVVAADKVVIASTPMVGHKLDAYHRLKKHQKIT